MEILTQLVVNFFFDKSLFNSLNTDLEYGERRLIIINLNFD